MCDDDIEEKLTREEEDTTIFVIWIEYRD